MIVVKPIGGLANRVRVLSSSVVLADKIGKKLHIIWDSNRELNCPYNSLFQPNDLFSVEEISTSRLSGRIGRLTGVVYRKLGYTYPFGYEKVFLDSEIQNLMNTKFDFTSLKQYLSVFINTCYPFYTMDYKKNHLSGFFSPLPHINEEVKKISENFNHHTVGIHIRGTDNKESIKISPVKVFIRLMGKEIMNNDRTTFFLATDDLNVESTLIERFGKRVFTRDKELARDSITGIQDALIDLMCLSKTKFIIGSYFSTFSGLASRLGEIELIIARDD